MDKITDQKKSTWKKISEGGSDTKGYKENDRRDDRQNEMSNSNK